MLRGMLLKNIYISISLILLIPLLGFGVYSANREKEYSLIAKAEELHKIATLIERRIPQHFDDILAQENAVQLPPEQQALILNMSLQPIIYELAAVYPNFGIGIASRELTRRIAMAPGYKQASITQPALAHRALKVYNTGESDVLQIKSANWDDKDTLAVSYPIYQKGRLVGHTWANTKIEDVNAMYKKSLSRWLVFSLLTWVAIVLVIAFFFKQFNLTVEHLAIQISQNDDERASLSDFPQLLPVLDTVITLRNDYSGEIKKLKQLVDVCPIAIVVTDNSGIILACNAMYDNISRTYLGADGDLIGRPTIQVPLAAGVPAEDLVVTRVLKGEANIESHQKLAGREWLVRGNPLLDEVTGDIMGAIISLTDITERESFRRDIEKLDRLTIIGEMAASVAHEIRNPLTVVRGNLQWLSLKSDNKSRYDLMIDELDRANAIIEDFLSLARNRPVPKSVCNINQIVSRLHQLIYSDAVKSSCVLELDLQQDVPDLFLNEKEIKQLILNLCRNSRDAMENNGRLTLRTRYSEDSVELQVQDNGCGIAAECINQVMEPFYTTKSQGTGLGLAICRSIAEKHSAELLVESQEGVGTTVTVRFARSNWTWDSEQGG